MVGLKNKKTIANELSSDFLISLIWIYPFFNELKSVLREDALKYGFVTLDKKFGLSR